MLKLQIHIKQVATGKSVCVEECVSADKLFNSIYNWSEGNNSCDCCRGLYFGDGEVSCSNGKYIVEKIALVGVDVVIYSETD